MSIKQYRGTIEEYEEHSQAPDAHDVKRFAKQLGTTYSKKGRKVWTNLFIYVQEPNLEHPFNIKLSLHNKKGKAFTQLWSLKDFDELLKDILDWRAEQEPGLQRCQEKGNRLLRNSKTLTKLSDLLSKTEYSAPPEITIDGVNVTALSVEREKEIIIKMINNLPTSSHKSWLIKDICARIDELQAMDIDCTDIADYLDSLNHAMEKERNYKQQINAESFETNANRYINKFTKDQPL